MVILFCSGDVTFAVHAVTQAKDRLPSRLEVSSFAVSPIAQKADVPLAKQSQGVSIELEVRGTSAGKRSCAKAAAEIIVLRIRRMQFAASANQVAG